MLPWRNWVEVVRTCNLDPQKRPDPVSRWLIITRACVLSMTLTSGMIAGLLAARTGTFHLWPFLLALVGILLAHVANNMINDLLDLKSGVDTLDYPRAQYSPHPLLHGLVQENQLIAAIVTINVLDLAILAVLWHLRGWPVAVFAILGLLISVFYVAPPVRLKFRGLGELSVFVVWGPLMIGGVYYATSGTLPGWVLAASFPYALLVTTVLIGKHLDKYDVDHEKGIGTLPVVLGFQQTLILNKIFMIGFYTLVFTLVLAATLSLWTLLVFLSLPRLRQVWATYSKTKPSTPPEEFPIWPLWYVAWAFWLTRRSGAFFILGLLLDLVVPAHM